MSREVLYKICVSGSAVLQINPATKEKAGLLGHHLATAKAAVLTGATSGYPLLAAKAAKAAGGMTIGFSPAISEREHEKKYRLPTEHHDLIIYTGFGYAGRNLFLVRSSDAVIHIAGRIGTINEFTNAFEDNKIIGVLLGTGGTSGFIDDIIEVADRGKGNVVYDDNPEILIDKVIRLLKREI